MHIVLAKFALDIIWKDDISCVIIYCFGTDKEKGVLFPVKFVPEKPGRYTCKIMLRSAHDVRVYMIECVVNPCSTETELEFITPACEALIQDIPIVS